MLESAEEFGRIVSSTLVKNSSNIYFTHKPNIEKENIGKLILIIYYAVNVLKCAYDPQFYKQFK